MKVRIPSRTSCGLGPHQLLVQGSQVLGLSGNDEEAMLPSPWLLLLLEEGLFM